VDGAVGWERLELVAVCCSLVHVCRQQRPTHRQTDQPTAITDKNRPHNRPTVRSSNSLMRPSLPAAATTRLSAVATAAL
jgi:hypothetical protein